MLLHHNQTTFKAAISATADYFGIPEIYIEKDYWVTLALKQIFTDKEISKIAVFKGGTSLSKCYKLIDRFSEDIDMVVITEASESSNAIKTKLKKVTNVIGGDLNYVSGHLLENKKGKVRKLVFDYQKAAVTGIYGQIRDEIVLEVSSLGSPYPSILHEVHTMIAQFIASTDNLGLIQQFELEPFKVNVLDIKRTFCEKIISLVRFSYTKNPLEDLADKVRHTYDLHMLLKHPEITAFIKTDAFETMLTQVGIDDDKAIPNNKEWLQKHPKEALFFDELESTWNSVKKTYNGTFKELITGEFPKDTVVYTSLMAIKKRLEIITWNI